MGAVCIAHTSQPNFTYLSFLLHPARVDGIGLYMLHLYGSRMTAWG
jgi:hypothetical protein